MTSGKLSAWARRMRLDLAALYLLARDPRTPWYAKLIAGITVAYALSPIDLIPDFIPIIGYFDDLILVPLGIWLALRLIPSELIAECREKAAHMDSLSRNWSAAMVIVVVWLMLCTAVIWAVVAKTEQASK